MENVERLQSKARDVRELILSTAFNAGRGHIAPALSLTDAMVALYFDVLRIDPKNPAWPKRDRCILSKGHGCLVLYAVLAEAGFFPKETMATFCEDGSILAGHPDRIRVPGVELSAGSLGHGLSAGVGIALAAQYDNEDYRTFVAMGDGELNEGSVWEAVMAGAHHKLRNLTAVVDRNRIQMTGTTSDIMGLEPLADKWRAFGWAVHEVNGHCFNDLLTAFNATAGPDDDRPKVVIANTIKGKGISFMENRPEWHFKIPSPEQYEIALAEIRNTSPSTEQA